MERQLATIRRVSQVDDIPNKDRIGLAHIDGWTVIVQKADIHANDLVVFCEIDSVLPDAEWCSFLKDSKRIKTMKMAGCLSQGIAFPLSILPAGTKVVEGMDVTEILGITKWERPDATDSVEDLLSKKPSKKYPAWLLRLLRKPFFRGWLGKWLLPKKVWKGFPEFVSRTDEVRVQNSPWYLDKDQQWVLTEKVDGCLLGDSYIKTDDGDITISKIVNQRLPVRVLSYNEELGICELKRITDYHKIPAYRDRYKIGVAFRGKGNRPKFIECTDNHKFLTQAGWKRADELTTDDKLWHFSRTFNSELFETLAGCLLGDASLNCNSTTGGYRTVEFSHSEEQKEYFDYKARLFGPIFQSDPDRTSGYGSLVHTGKLKTNLQIWNWVNIFFPNGQKMYVTKSYADMLTPISLAFWFMDDGNLKNREDDTLGCRAVFNTQAYDYEEVEILQDALLRKFNIHSKIGDSETYKGFVLSLGVEDTDKLASLIAPYVCKSMKYKLPKRYESMPCVFEGHVFDASEGIVETDILSIEKVDTDESKVQWVYDLEVEDNHNYFAKNVLVHNCSGTFAVKRTNKVWGPKFETFVCSRNIRLSKPDNSSYWRVWKKYGLEQILISLCNSLQSDWVCIQGEVIGPSIQGNKYKRTEPELYVFNFITSRDGRWASADGKLLLEPLGLNWVPIIGTGYLPKSVEEMLTLAHGPSRLSDTLREGLVCRSLDGVQSFKAVDPEFLMKWGE